MIQIRLALIFLLNYVHFIHTYNTKLHYFNKQTKQITKLACVSYLTLLSKKLLCSRSRDVYHEKRKALVAELNQRIHDITRDKTLQNPVRQPQANPVAFHLSSLTILVFPTMQQRPF